MVGSYDDDNELMAAIQRAVAESAIVPPGAFEVARVAFQLRAIDSELELLTMLYDSSLDGEAVVRGSSYVSAQYLTFQGNELTLEVEISTDNILGQVIPPQVASVSLVTSDGEFAACETDDLGGLLLPRPPSGHVRLACRTAASSLLTDWISV